MSASNLLQSGGVSIRHFRGCRDEIRIWNLGWHFLCWYILEEAGAWLEGGVDKCLLNLLHWYYVALSSKECFDPSRYSLSGSLPATSSSHPSHESTSSSVSTSTPELRGSTCLSLLIRKLEFLRLLCQSNIRPLLLIHFGINAQQQNFPLLCFLLPPSL